MYPDAGPRLGNCSGVNGLRSAPLFGEAVAARRARFFVGKAAYGMRSLLKTPGGTEMKRTSVLCFSALALLWMSGCGGAAGNGNTANSNHLAANTNRDNAAVYSTNTNSNSNMSNSMANSNSAGSDTDFMKEAAIGGMAEVELGRLAASKAVNAEVKKFGQMMVEDHSKANADLKTLAAKKNAALPTDLDAEHKSTMDELRAKTGADFDREYVEEMVDDHEEDVAAFEKQAQSATDPDVKAFAAKTLPVLKKHLDAIKAIQAKMK